MLAMGSEGTWKRSSLSIRTLPVRLVMTYSSGSMCVNYAVNGNRLCLQSDYFLLFLSMFVEHHDNQKNRCEL
jgi:hypothetical protein